MTWSKHVTSLVYYTCVRVWRWFLYLQVWRYSRRNTAGRPRTSTWNTAGRIRRPNRRSRRCCTSPASSRRRRDWRYQILLIFEIKIIYIIINYTIKATTFLFYKILGIFFWIKLYININSTFWKGCLMINSSMEFNIYILYNILFYHFTISNLIPSSLLNCCNEFI